jgi:uncharacterized phiE125 gp8 family phage protein
MNFVLELVTPPDIEPVTLAEMKKHLRVEHTDDDDEINSIIKSAREWVEDETGRVLIEQTWRLTLTRAANLAGRVLLPVTNAHVNCASEILLHKSPVIAIDSVVTVDSAGTETTITTTDYQLRQADSKWPKIFGLNGTIFAADTTRIEFRAGYAVRTTSPSDDASVVPARFKLAMKLWGEANYDRDEKTMETLMTAAKNVIKPERSDLQIS